MAKHHMIGDRPELAHYLPTLPAKDQSHAYFSSPEAIARYLDNLSKKDCFARTGWDRHDESFYGTRTMQEAINLCLEGWQEGATQVATLRDKIMVANPVGQRLVRWDIAGAYPSVPRALAGNPLHMRRIDSARLRRKPVITLIHQMNGLSYVTSKVFNNKAAAMAAIVDCIEGAGFSVELIGATLNNGEGGSFQHCLAVTLKEPGQPVDTGRIAFALGHAAFWRRMIFGIMCEKFNSQLGYGMGSTVEFPAKPQQGYLLPSANQCCKQFGTEQDTIEKGIPFLVQTLTKQDCPAFPKAQAA